jgi:hypothetical protein
MEGSNNTNVNISEVTTGQPTGNRFQIVIQNSTSNLFDIRDKAANVIQNNQNNFFMKI